MIANDVYYRLKKAKGKASFSVLINELLELKKENKGAYLREIAGLLKGDKEYDDVMKELKKRWSRWTKNYV